MISEANCFTVLFLSVILLLVLEIVVLKIFVLKYRSPKMYFVITFDYRFDYRYLTNAKVILLLTISVEHDRVRILE